MSFFGMLGVCVAIGLVLAVFTRRLPRFQTAAFRDLPDFVREPKIRRVRRLGIALATLSLATGIAFTTLGYVAAKRHQRLHAADAHEEVIKPREQKDIKLRVE